jgi:hypothetical protein
MHVLMYTLNYKKRSGDSLIFNVGRKKKTPDYLCAGLAKSYETKAIAMARLGLIDAATFI